MINLLQTYISEDGIKNRNGTELRSYVSTDFIGLWYGYDQLCGVKPRIEL